MLKSLNELVSDENIKRVLRTQAGLWLNDIKKQKDELRSNNPEDWSEVKEDIKLRFVQLIGAERFIVKFFEVIC